MSKYPYPEHEKLRASEREAQTLSSFIDFIAQQGWELCKWDDNQYTPRPWRIQETPEEIIGMFLGIDPQKLEAEKVAMLKEIRKANSKN